MYYLTTNLGHRLSSAVLQRLVSNVSAGHESLQAEAMIHLSAIERIEARGISYSNEDFDVLSRAFTFVAKEGFRKHPGGRCMAKAIADGDYYLVCFRKGDDARGAWDGESGCPGAGGIEESLLAARMNWPEAIGRKVFVERVTGGSIGCRMVEPAGEFVL